LGEQGVVGTPSELARLISAYAGNPLALKMVTQSLMELFGGDITSFLAQDTTVLGSLRELLSKQFARLSELEQTVLLWLAVARESVTIAHLFQILGTPLPRTQVLEAIEGLRRRSLIERGVRAGSFTLQSVVLEYATAQLIADVADEIQQGKLSRLIEHALELATAREYVRQTQERLIVTPLLESLRSAYPMRGAIEAHLLALLDQQRERADYAQGYGPANLLALLCKLRGHLRGLNLSHLSLRGAYLQGVEMQDTTLAGARLGETVFTEAFDAPWVVAISPNGDYRVAGNRRGKYGYGVREGSCWIRAGKPIPLRCRLSLLARMDGCWPAGVVMRRSSCGTWSTLRSSGWGGIPAVSKALPLLPMDISSRAEEIPLFSSGMSPEASLSKRSLTR
jgi:hypothetical protein